MINLRLTDETASEIRSAVAYRAEELRRQIGTAIHYGGDHLVNGEPISVARARLRHLDKIVENLDFQLGEDYAEED